MSLDAAFAQDMSRAIKEVHDAGGGRREFKAAVSRVIKEYLEQQRALWLHGAKS